jgi:hypothetical protein
MGLMIKTMQRQFDQTCTLASNLTENQKVAPQIRDVIQYAEPRMLSTLIVGGAQTMWDTVSNNTKTKIGVIPSDKLIGDVGYRYAVMGRLQRKTVILGQVGTSGSDGSFSLRVRENLLYPGMNVAFYNDSFSARVMGPGTPASVAGGGWVYQFQSNNGHVFVYADDVAPQAGEKTCFGGNTSYEEGSKRGYSRAFFEDYYINHLTTQRKSLGMTGDALTTVTWVMFNNDKGWLFEKEQQVRVQFMMEDEHAKWHGRSTMRDEAGNLLQVSNQIDPATGKPITAGDGLIPQIEDGNISWGSDTDGMATLDDHKDMITMLKKYSSTAYGSGISQEFTVVTGTTGYLKAQTVLQLAWVNSFGGSHQKTGATLGDVEVGGNFDTFIWSGTKLTFCEHPMFSDEERYANKASDGDPMLAGSYIYLDRSKTGKGNQRNVEILTKGAYGINRSMVSTYVNGLTGWLQKDATSGVDALEYHCLKQDGIFVYNIKSCGIIKRSFI